MTGDAVRRGSVSEEKKGKVIHPVSSALVGSAAHGDEGTIQSFGDAGGLMVMSGGGREINAGSAHDLGSQLGRKVRTQVVANAAGRAVTAYHVGHEHVEQLFGRGLT